MIQKDNYYSFNDLSIKNAFFIKPYNFNSNIVESSMLTKQYNEVKEILELDNIATVKQCHTSKIKKVTLNNIDELDIADGMITNIKGIGLATKVADCQAIFLYDPVKKVIGNIHSGWKGTLLKIVGTAIKVMVNDYQSNINDIKVYINPSIDLCHFEVDEDVYLEFKNSFKQLNINEYVLYKENLNKYYVNLKSINKDYLISLGILEKNIIISKMCTVCNGKIMHSYRYDKENSGRNLAVISL